MGLHEAIEGIPDLPNLLQVYYLDDGIFRSTLPVLQDLLKQLTPALRNIGLEVNISKCELYTSDTGLKTTPGLRNIPVISDRNAWSYLGSPLAANSSAAFKGVLRRLDALSESLSKMAQRYPQQVLQLLRATMGACRIEHLLQSLPITQLQSELVLQCQANLRKGLSAVLSLETVTH